MSPKSFSPFQRWHAIFSHSVGGNCPGSKDKPLPRSQERCHGADTAEPPRWETLGQLNWTIAPATGGLQFLNKTINYHKTRTYCVSRTWSNTQQFRDGIYCVWSWEKQIQNSQILTASSAHSLPRIFLVKPMGVIASSIFLWYLENLGWHF